MTVEYSALSEMFISFLQSSGNVVEEGKECNSEILVKWERLSSGHHMDGWYSPELQEAVVICAGSA